MSLRAGTVRMLAILGALLVVGVALVLRALVDGPLEQHSGTALYACMVYAGAVFLGPRLRPPVVAVAAVGFCWAIEFFQLTGVPAALSARSVLARLALGAQFDATDVAWYPVGVVPPLLLHLWLRRR